MPELIGDTPFEARKLLADVMRSSLHAATKRWRETSATYRRGRLRLRLRLGIPDMRILWRLYTIVLRSIAKEGTQCLELGAETSHFGTQPVHRFPVFNIGGALVNVSPRVHSGHWRRA